ncbi:MAG: hypothetical protein KC441_10490 [Anaerolineales bacterium]|nr:hypothetical protein [Anaerolineales bacterium]
MIAWKGTAVMGEGGASVCKLGIGPFRAGGTGGRVIGHSAMIRPRLSCPGGGQVLRMDKCLGETAREEAVGGQKSGRAVPPLRGGSCWPGGMWG